MSEVEKSSTSRIIWIAIIAAACLIIAAAVYNSGKLFPGTDQETGAGTSPSGPNMPAAGTSSGQGTFRSSGDMKNPQSLSGNPRSGAPSIADGKVVDASGKGVPDVRVQCSSCLSSAATVLTDEAGKFKLPYYLEQKEGIDKMDIQLSKGSLSAKHPVSINKTTGLVLELK